MSLIGKGPIASDHAGAARPGDTMDETAAKGFPRIASSRKTVLSEWATLIENRVVTSSDDAGAVYHSIATADYVSILVVTPDGRIPLVRQFRPALDRITFEFPGGLRDGEEAPAACAVRELAEEVGLEVAIAQPLARFHPDSGRLANRMWAFFASNATPIPGWRPEAGVERTMVGIDELYALAIDGSFDHGPHLAMLGIATIKGLLQHS
jgi:ADP-ribose pyrophosphatase